jgi:alkanesulfonate monooxygenase SsuD/methylene tetrahydromethanopterin reductase-like flavin-dependent oxidoreductase (luciferase family)
VARAGTLGLPLTIAIIGGTYAPFAGLVELYREAFAAGGRDPAQAKVAINTHAFVGDSLHAADSAFAASYLAMMNRIGRERGWPASGQREYEALRSSAGPLAVGSPAAVAEKILAEHALFGNQRYVAQMSVGAVAHRDVMRSMELFGTEVATLVRVAVGGSMPTAGTVTA